MLPLVATGKCWILGVKRQETRRSGVPGIEPRASGTHGRKGSGQRQWARVGGVRAGCPSPHSQGPRQLSPWVPLPPGGSLGQSSCRHSASLQLPHGSVGLVGGRTAAISSHPVRQWWCVREGQPTPAPYPSLTHLLKSHPMGLQLQNTT